MPVARARWQELVDGAEEDAVASPARVSASEAERARKAAGFDPNAQRANAKAVIAVLIGPDGPPKEEADVASEGQGRVRAPAPPARRAGRRARAPLRSLVFETDLCVL